MFTASFLQNIIILLITAILTGIIVPLLFRSIDARRNREQKIFEAELSRQSKIIDAQVKLLEDLSSLLWEYQLLLIEVPYYHQFPEVELFNNALKAYNENSGKVLGKIRAEISKALRLTPYSLFQELIDLYYNRLLPLDLKVSEIASREKRNGKEDSLSMEWAELQRHILFDLSKIVDNIVDKLANELKLKAYEVNQTVQKQ